MRLQIESDDEKKMGRGLRRDVEEEEEEEEGEEEGGGTGEEGQEKEEGKEEEKEQGEKRRFMVQQQRLAVRARESNVVHSAGADSARHLATWDLALR
jgi:hypothetical protein